MAKKKFNINWWRLLISWFVAGSVSGIYLSAFVYQQFSIPGLLGDAAFGIIRPLFNAEWVALIYGVIAGVLYYNFGYPKK